MTGAQLLHEPEGDRNPYDSVPWSRHPLQPTEHESFRVGVRAPSGVRSVSLEWRTPDGAGALPLEEGGGDVWAGELAPFTGRCDYRFVASDDSDVSTATEWFSAGVTRWDSIVLTDAWSDGEALFISGDRAELTLKPGGDIIRWNIGNSTRESDMSGTVKVSGWTATIRDGRVTVSNGDHVIVIGLERATVDGSVTAWRIVWELEDDERLFGTGERFDSFDQRGKVPDIRVYEEYKAQGARTYLPIPWILSSRGYGLAIDGATRVEFDLGATQPDQATATIPSAEDATGTLYFGTPKKIITQYTADVGRPSPMPIWAYGPWMSGNEWDNDERVREVVARTQQEAIPASVIVIEAWSDESTFYLFNDATYAAVPGAEVIPVESIRHAGKWPDPAGLVDWLHGQGIRVLLWQIPVLKDTDDHEQQLADLGHVDDAGLAVGTTDGGTYRNRGWWFPKGRVIDFSNAEARKWWFSKRSYLIDEFGVDGFKTDGGEHLWGTDVVTSNGATGHEAANEYPNNYISAYHDFLADHGHERPLTFSRAGFTGSQKYPAHWAGDEDSTWEAYRASLTAGLSAGMSGIAFWGWDLAGFSKELPSAELYKRSSAMAAFMPIMQYHSEHNEHRLPLADRTPWNVAAHTEDDDVTSVYRFYARLRMNMVPYLLTLGTEAVETGLPMMRAMAVEFPDDDVACAVDDQFLLGSDILVAPVTEPGVAHSKVYLPDGEWSDFWTGTPVEAGWSSVPCSQNEIPVYVRGGACIPLWMEDQIALGVQVGLPELGSGRLVLMVFPGTSKQRLIDPLTYEPWAAEVRTDGLDLVIRTEGAPADVTAWIRGADGRESDRCIRIPSGDATTRVRVVPDD